MKKIKLLYSLLGVLCISLAVTFFRLADLGTDPYTTFNLGLSDFFNMNFGVFIMVSSVIMLIFVFFMNRSLIGIGTLLNIIIVGNLSDVLVNFYIASFSSPENIILRILFSILGVLFLSIGPALYIEAKEGIAPYDALPIILEEKLNGKLSFRLSRVIIDILSTLIGYLFGATIGINSVITAFFLGPIIQFFRELFQKDLNRRALKYASKK